MSKYEMKARMVTDADNWQHQVYDVFDSMGEVAMLGVTMELADKFMDENTNTCHGCEHRRPNGVCELTLSTNKEACDQYCAAEGDKVCNCGYWSCGGRGCGDCPDCCGEVCECDDDDDGLIRLIHCMNLVINNKEV